MKSASIRARLALLTALVIPAVLQAATFDWQDKPEANHEMAFRLYLPDGLAKARAVIALVPGHNGDGRPMADDQAWKDLANRTQCALLGCSMKGDAGGAYYDPELWSGKVFLEALKKLAAESKHPEIADAPIAFWGHSAGGQFNFNFANWKPERTLAFVANKGAYYGQNTRPTTKKIPALWILGVKDTDERVKNITAKYEDGRKSGALWALVPEPNEGHGEGRSREIGMIFIEESLASRLDSFGKLQPANPTKGWFGNLETKTVGQTLAPNAKVKDFSWFPGPSTAKVWAEIVGAPAS